MNLQAKQNVTKAFATLGLEEDADERAVLSAYRKLALRWHPDKNPGNPTQATAKFQEISLANDVLGKWFETGRVEEEGGEEMEWDEMAAFFEFMFQHFVSNYEKSFRFSGSHRRFRQTRQETSYQHHYSHPSPNNGAPDLPRREQDENDWGTYYGYGDATFGSDRQQRYRAPRQESRTEAKLAGLRAAAKADSEKIHHEHAERKRTAQKKVIENQQAARRDGEREKLLQRSAAFTFEKERQKTQESRSRPFIAARAKDADAVKAGILEGNVGVNDLEFPDEHRVAKWERLLHLAVRMENVDLVGWLLQNGARINIPDSTGLTPFHLALHLGIASIVSFLLSPPRSNNQTSRIFRPPSPTESAKDGRSPVELAALSGSIDCLQLVLGEADTMDAKKALKKAEAKKKALDAKKENSAGLTAVITCLCSHTGLTDEVPPPTSKDVPLLTNTPSPSFTSPPVETSAPLPTFETVPPTHVIPTSSGSASRKSHLKREKARKKRELEELKTIELNKAADERERLKRIGREDRMRMKTRDVAREQIEREKAAQSKRKEGSRSQQPEGGLVQKREQVEKVEVGALSTRAKSEQMQGLGQRKQKATEEKPASRAPNWVKMAGERARKSRKHGSQGWLVGAAELYTAFESQRGNGLSVMAIFLLSAVGVLIFIRSSKV